MLSRALYISLLSFAAAAIARSQGLAPAVGDRWIYDTELRDGTSPNLQVHHWSQEDITVAIEDVPEGRLIRRRVRLLEGAAPSWARVPQESNILLRGACIYYLQDSFLNHFYSWDNQRHELTVAFRKELAAGKTLPDACFPLRQDAAWSIPNMREATWTVAGTGPKNRDDPSSVTAQSWRFEANLASGDENLVWFQEGVGVTASRILHHGSYHDERVRLLSFESAR
jgi:hypothetical protein